MFRTCRGEERDCIWSNISELKRFSPWLVSGFLPVHHFVFVAFLVQ